MLLSVFTLNFYHRLKIILFCYTPSVCGLDQPVVRRYVVSCSSCSAFLASGVCSLVMEIESESEVEVDEPGQEANGLQPSTREPFTTKEKSLLLTLVESRKKIVEDKRTSFGPKCRKDKAWDAITLEFNSDPDVNVRTKTQLKNWWNNSKKRARKDVSN